MSTARGRRIQFPSSRPYPGIQQPIIRNSYRPLINAVRPVIRQISRPRHLRELPYRFLGGFRGAVERRPSSALHRRTPLRIPTATQQLSGAAFLRNQLLPSERRLYIGTNIPVRSRGTSRYRHRTRPNSLRVRSPQIRQLLRHNMERLGLTTTSLSRNHLRQQRSRQLTRTRAGNTYRTFRRRLQPLSRPLRVPQFRSIRILTNTNDDDEREEIRRQYISTNIPAASENAALRVNVRRDLAGTSVLLTSPYNSAIITQNTVPNSQTKPKPDLRIVQQEHIFRDASGITTRSQASRSNLQSNLKAFQPYGSKNQVGHNMKLFVPVANTLHAEILPYSRSTVSANSVPYPGSVFSEKAFIFPEQADSPDVPDAENFAKPEISNTINEEAFSQHTVETAKKSTPSFSTGDIPVRENIASIESALPAENVLQTDINTKASVEAALQQEILSPVESVIQAERLAPVEKALQAGNVVAVNAVLPEKPVFYIDVVPSKVDVSLDTVAKIEKFVSIDVIPSKSDVPLDTVAKIEKVVSIDVVPSKDVVSLENVDTVEKVASIDVVPSKSDVPLDTIAEIEKVVSIDVVPSKDVVSLENVATVEKVASIDVVPIKDDVQLATVATVEKVATIDVVPLKDVVQLDTVATVEKVASIDVVPIKDVVQLDTDATVEKVASIDVVPVKGDVPLDTVAKIEKVISIDVVPSKDVVQLDTVATVEKVASIDVVPVKGDVPLDTVAKIEKVASIDVVPSKSDIPLDTVATGEKVTSLDVVPNKSVVPLDTLPR